MASGENKIKEVLLRRGYTSEEDIESAERSVKEGKAFSAIQYLLDKELIDKDIMGQAFAEEFGVPYADLNSEVPPKDQVLKLPEELARRYMVVIFRETENNIILATSNPEQKNLLVEVKAYLESVGVKKEVSLAYSLAEDIVTVFLHYRRKLEARFLEILKREKKVAPQIVSEIFEDAVLYRVSDIHFEPEEEDVTIRFRIDGVLNELGRIPKEYYENILNRIKVQARLRIDDHFSAQDGSLRYISSAGPVDARVSIMPTLDGEKIVIRVLTQYVRSMGLPDLGLSEENQKALLEAAKKPFGMVLIAGPTGSGKTTTLYALLKILNNPQTNITTIEDPVEYRVPGVNQVQVNPETNLTFADGLKSIVRQDPDIILVGEIRDRETAEIAVNAALTGHLLFSTFHANDAATAIPRLLDMGIEPFLMASTMQVIVAQRLVRKICESCRYSMPAGKDIVRRVGEKYITEGMALYEGKGCEACNMTGYRGRTAIFEIIKITKEMQELILKNPPTHQVWQLARSQGSKSLFEDGIFKVRSGITTVEELLRVAEAPKE